MKYEAYSVTNSYTRVATACPEVVVGDVTTNVARISQLYKDAVDNQVSLVLFPELSVTGYTLGDLVHQTGLLDRAETGLLELADKTAGQAAAMVVGLPLRVGNGLYNCAAVLANGRVKGIVPKLNLPTYGEFYEARWYQPWDQPNTKVDIIDTSIPFGSDLLFDIAGVRCGVEICEDLWAVEPPSVKLAKMGANLILNPSASPEQIDKATKRRNLVVSQSGRLAAGYVYAGCDVSESTAEIVMGGHQIIAANGSVISEAKPFSGSRLLVADIDRQHLAYERRKRHMANLVGAMVVKTETMASQVDLRLSIDPNPFLPAETESQRDERLETTLTIQAFGLARRMKATHQDKLVLGLSGGLDSTLALVVALRAADILGIQPSDMIETITMPGLASSSATQSNAQELASSLGVSNKQIPINELSSLEMSALGHNGVTQDITYENVQARARTSLLFNYANLHHAIVLGTGDLSEIAMGWCTYNADQQSHYNVNASIPKTVVRELVAYASRCQEFVQAKAVLEDILATPISPELTSSSNEGISQSTEDIIGPYELHDFYLYYLLRWGDAPAKITYLAAQAFKGRYTTPEIDHWFSEFIGRFARSQFKRDNSPNGPKVEAFSLSPRGDWRMPSDLYNSAIWSDEN